MTETMRRELPPGTFCERCGALVTGKEIIPGEDRQHPWEIAVRREADRLGANLPCGHDALAIWWPPEQRRSLRRRLAQEITDRGFTLDAERLDALTDHVADLIEAAR